MNEAPSPPPTITFPLLRKALADGLGTFALVFVGCGAIVVDAQQGGLGHTGVCLAFGLVVGVMVCATGHISGAHFNPAVTLAFATIGRFPWRQVPAYILAQTMAAVFAALLVSALLGNVANLGATVPSVSLGSALGIEGVLTFLLMFVITGVATDGRASGHLAAVAIGGAVTLGALVGGPLTGASMNPARTLGPAVVSGTFDGLVIYLVAPVIGAVAGAWTYGLVACAPPDGDAQGCC